LIEQGKVSEPIRQFLNGLSLMNSHLDWMVNEAAESIAQAEKALPIWTQAVIDEEAAAQENESKYSDKVQIACLWVHVLNSQIIEHLNTLAIQDSMLKLEAGEFTPAQRQRVKEEISATLTEIQNISNELRAKSGPAPPPTLFQ
jgi:hypothetical protein